MGVIREQEAFYEGLKERGVGVDLDNNIISVNPGISGLTRVSLSLVRKEPTQIGIRDDSGIILTDKAVVSNGIQLELDDGTEMNLYPRQKDESQNVFWVTPNLRLGYFVREGSAVVPLPYSDKDLVALLHEMGHVESGHVQGEEARLLKAVQMEREAWVWVLRQVEFLQAHGVELSPEEVNKLAQRALLTYDTGYIIREVGNDGERPSFKDLFFSDPYRKAAMRVGNILGEDAWRLIEDVMQSESMWSPHRLLEALAMKNERVQQVMQDLEKEREAVMKQSEERWQY